MAQTIKIKRSSTSGNKLTSSNSVAGELGLNTADKALYIQTGSTNGDVVTIAHESTLKIDEVNGRIGIGTTSPGTTLDVNGDIRAVQAIYSEGSSPRVQLQDTDGTNQFSFFQQSTSQLSLRLRNDTSDGSFLIAGYGSTTTTNRMLIGSTGDLTYYRDDGSTTALFLDASNGNVGINTTSPDTKLDIDGLVNGGIAFTATQVEIDRQSVLPNGRIFYNDSRLIYDSPANGHRFAVAGNQGSNLALEIYSNRDIGFYNSSAAVDLFWDASTSQLGIGTTSPDRALHVKDGALVVQKIESSNTGGVLLDIQHAGTQASNTGAYAGLRFYDNGGHKMSLSHITESSGNGYVQIGTSWATGGEILSVHGNGRVGIGTTSPSQKLDVEGLIRSGGIAHPEIELVPTGSLGNADIRFDGTSLDIRSNSSGAYLTLQTATTERLKITNTGNFEFNNGNFTEVGTISSGEITTTDDINISSGKALRFGAYDYIKLDDDSGTYGGGTNRVTIASISNVVIHADTNGNGPLGEGLQVWTGSTPEKRFEALGERTSVFGTLASPPTIRLSNTTTAFTQGDNVGQIEFYHADPTDFTPGAFGIIRGVAGASGGEGSIQVLTNMPSEGTDANDVAIEFTGAGAVKISDAFTLPTSDGSGNQVLQTDGSGNVSWASISGVGAPTYMEDADGDTKIQVEESADEDIIRFDTAGSQRMVIDSGGNFGFGVDTPSNYFHVKKNSAGIIARIEGTSGRYIYTGTDSGGHYLEQVGTSAAERIFRIQSSNGSSTYTVLSLDGHNQRIYTDAGAKFGIGTTPSYKLHVNDTQGDVAYISSSDPDGNGATNGRVLHVRDNYATTSLDSYVSAGWTSSPGQDVYIGKRTTSGAGYLAIKNSSGTEHFTINMSSGNVGIGTTSPGVELDIKRHTNPYPLRIGSSQGEGRVIVYADVNTSPTKYNWIAGTQYNINDGYEITPSTAVGGYTFSNPAIVVLSNRNVGIGTNSPAKTLVVSGTFQATGEAFFSHFDNITSNSRMRDDLRLNFGTARTFAIAGNSSNMHMKNGTTDVMTFDTSNRVGIGTASPAKTLDVAANGSSQGIHLNISGVGRLQMYADGDRNYFKGLSGNGHRFTTTGGANVEIQNGGNVGIGTTSPQAVLDLGNGTNGRGIAWGGSNGTAHYNTIWSEYSTASIIIGSGLKGATDSATFLNPFTGTYGYAAIELDSFSDDGIKFYTGADASRTKDAAITPTEQMRLTNAGRLGIGTTNPLNPLYVKKTGGTHLMALETSYASDRTGRGQISWRDASNITGAIWTEYDSAQVSMRFGNLFNSGYNTNTSMIIRGNGNVGIGTVSPAQKLHVDGNAEINGSIHLDGTSTGSGGISYGTGTTQPSVWFWGEDHSSYPGQIHIVGRSDNAAAHSGEISFWDYTGSSWNRNMLIQKTGNVNIGTSTAFTVGGTAKLSISTSTNVYLTAGASNSDLIYSRRQGAGHFQSQAYNGGNNGTIEHNPYGGKVGVGTAGTVSSTFQVEALGIDTTTTSTTATTQVAIDTFAAATFRSAKYTIQVTNTTDSSYHVTEILLIHDGTTPGITEYGTVFTGSAAEATFDADISSGNVRLLATPASTDSMTFKVVRHCITV